MKYKGYTGIVQFDEEAMIFHGEVVGIRDVITFRGTTPEELKREFETSVDGYLDWCQELGQEPEKPYSGKFNVRVSPELHARLAITAKAYGESLNSFVQHTLEKAVNPLDPGTNGSNHRPSF